jgi:hypothetical protein
VLLISPSSAAAEEGRGHGAGHGGPVSDLGQQGEDSVHDVANMLGLITFVYCSSRPYGSEKAAR